MLLAIDVGNSNTSVGLFDRDKQLRFLASLDTDSRKTADQISIDLMNLFALYHFRFEDVTGAILCSVVPPLNFMMEKALSRLLGKPPMVVGPGVRTGLNIRLAVQSQVGADIVADAVAALGRLQPPIITIDMGTATTIGVISEGRNYEGGMLLPGVNVSLEALSRRAAQLPAISLQHPKVLIGKTTEDCMRSGIVYGPAAMLVLNAAVADQLRQFKAEVDAKIATGKDKFAAIIEVIRKDIKECKAIHFDGNGYSEEWKAEAARRGLDCETSVPLIFDAYLKDSSVRMFESTGVMTRKELEARNEVKWEMYTKKIQIEARVLGDLTMNHIIPMATKYQSSLIDNVYKMRELFPADKAAHLSSKNMEIIEDIANRTIFIKEKVDEMVNARKIANKIESEREKAIAYHDRIVPMMEAIRYHIDKLELVVDDQIWTLPKHRELLFIR